MVQEYNLSLLIPLLILVSLGISRTCRELSHDRYLKSGSWGFSRLDILPSPNLGVVSYLYISNNMLMFLTFQTVVSSVNETMVNILFGTGNMTGVALSLIVAIVWILVPLMQFNEYEYIEPQIDSAPPASVLVHIGIVSLLSLGLIIRELMYRVYENPTSITDIDVLRFTLVIPVIITGVIFVVGSLLFLKEFESEIREYTSIQSVEKGDRNRKYSQRIRK